MLFVYCSKEEKKKKKDKEEEDGTVPGHYGNHNRSCSSRVTYDTKDRVVKFFRGSLAGGSSHGGCGAMTFLSKAAP